MFKQTLALIAIVLMLFSCTASDKNNYTKKAYQTLDTLSNLYNATFETLEELDARGLIKPQNKAPIKRMMSDAYDTIGTAGKSLKAYIKDSNDKNKQEYEAYVSAFHVIIQEINKMLEEKDEE